MSTENDRYVENAGISFAIHCDENDLNDEDAQVLAERLYDWFCETVDERRRQRAAAYTHLLTVIATALLSAQNEAPDDADRADAYVDAHVILDALLAHGERWQRIGRAFYDDTDEGQPVLVIPLPVVEPRDTEQAPLGLGIGSECDPMVRDLPDPDAPSTEQA